MVETKMIFGITGRKGHGKDTISDILVKKYDFEKLSFADPLKRAVKEIFNLSDQQLYGYEKEFIDKYWKVTPREILQFVGTELFRNQLKNLIPDVEENIWVKVLENKIKNVRGNIVISDVRFPNEVDMIKKLNGKIIKIIRPNLENNTLSNHISENLDTDYDYDYIIINDKGIDDLYEEIGKIIVMDNR